MLRALARNGGVIGINFGGGFLSAKDAEGYKKRIADRRALQPPGTGSQLDSFAKEEFVSGYLKMTPSAATLEDAVAHIDHVVKVAELITWGSAATSTASQAFRQVWRTCRRCLI